MKHTTPVLANVLFLGACVLLMTSCAGNEVQNPQPPVTSLKSEQASAPETNQAVPAALADQPANSDSAKPAVVTSGPNYPVDQYTRPAPAPAAAVVAAPVIAASAVAPPQPSAPVRRNFMNDGSWWPWLLLLLLLALLGRWLWSRYHQHQMTSAKNAGWTDQGLLGVDAGLADQKLLGMDGESADEAILAKHVKKHRALLAKRTRAHQSVLAKHARSAHRLKLAKEAELAAQAAAAKQAASAKKGILAKIARARHRRLLAKKAKAHQAVLAKHARLNHRLNLAKAAEAAALAVSARHAQLTRQAAVAKQARSAHRLKLAKEAELAAQAAAAKQAALAKKGILAKIERLRHRRLLAKRRRAYQALLAERAREHQAALAKHARSARRLKLAKEAEMAALAAAAKHAASTKKGLLAKAAGLRHQRLLAKRAEAHQAVLAEHEEATHQLNLSKEAEGVASAAPAASAVPEKHAELIHPGTSTKGSILGDKTILPTDAGLGHDEILVQGAGLNEVVKVSIKRGATFQEIIVSVAKMGNFPAAKAHLFLEDEEAPLNPNHRVDAKHPLHKIHHVHTQKEIGVEVHFNGEEHQMKFSPATTVRKVLAWAAHEFKIPDQDGKEVFLSMPDSSVPLQDTAHIGRFVPHDQNKLVLDVMNPTRV